MFNLCNRLMGLFGLNRVCCADDFDDEEIDRGQDIMNRERDAKSRYQTTVRKVGQLTKSSPTSSPKKESKRPSNAEMRDVSEIVRSPRGELRELPSTVSINLEDDSSSESNSLDDEIFAKIQPTPVQKVFGFFDSLVASKKQKEEEDSNRNYI